MLRVRPLHFTSRIDDWDRLLLALGLVLTEGDGGFRVYDSAAGRLALHSVEEGDAADGTTALAVEVRDLAEFARRTNLSAEEDGSTPAELVTVGHGESCRITAPDGFSFLADRAADGETSGNSASAGAAAADADPALAVVAVWFTADPEAAARTLLHIGARPRPVPDNDETADFSAKNGGILMVRPASGPSRSGLGFEYDGGLEPLRQRLASAGFTVSATEEAFGSTLHISNPDATAFAASVPATVWISERRAIR